MSHSQPDQGLYIREARKSDEPALNRICLLTGDAGKSAEKLHSFGELIGLVYVDPYVNLPTAFGYVLVDPSKGDAVVAYAVATHNTRAFERAAQEEWWPRVRAKYAYPPELNEGVTQEDKKFIQMLYNPSTAGNVQIDFSPAHMHINILPEYQRQGWGRKLIAHIVSRLKEKHGLERLYLGVDPRNVDAKRFYERLGYRAFPAAQGYLGLEFRDLQG